MTITFQKGWNDPENNGYFVEIPGNPDSWRDKGTRMRANESNIETIIGHIPADKGTIDGDHIGDVVDSIQRGDVVVVKGIHSDKWEPRLGKHITVQLGDPYLDTYHLYGAYYLSKLRWIVTYISKGMPLKIGV